MGQLYGNNTRGHGDDAVTENHHDTGNDLAELGLGGDIPIAYGGQGDDGPIDAHRNAGKAVFGAFHQIHDGSDDDDGVDDGKEKHGDLVATGHERVGQHGTFIDEMCELENAENPQ